MEIKRLKSEKLNVLENFVNELSNELNVDFFNQVSTFERGVQRGKKYKVEKFKSTLYKSLSIGYEVSFIPHSNESVELWVINVKERGKGLGSEILSKVLDVSDRTGIKVKLVPVDYDRNDNTPKNYLDSLKNWYTEGFGFQRPKFSFDPYYTYYPSVEEYKMVS
jgi:hypothetical protein